MDQNSDLHQPSTDSSDVNNVTPESTEGESVSSEPPSQPSSVSSEVNNVTPESTEGKSVSSEPPSQPSSVSLEKSQMTEGKSLSTVPLGGNAIGSDTVEKEAIKKIAEKHAPEERGCKVKPIMEVIEDFFHHYLFKPAGVAREIHRPVRTSSEAINSGELDWAIRYTINHISWKIIHCHSKGVDVQTTTIAVLDLLDKLSWEVKVVLVLAAFAMSYGEFWLTIAAVEENPFNLSVFMFKQLRFQQRSALAPKFLVDSLAILIRSMFDLANWIILFKDYAAEFQTQLEVQIASYRIVKTVVWCIYYYMDMVKRGAAYGASDAEVSEIKTYTLQLKQIYEALTAELEKNFLAQEQKIISASYDDVTELIQKFFEPKDRFVMWYNSRTGKKLPNSEGCLEALKGRCVALFISDFNFDVKLQEFNVLEETYNKIMKGDNRNTFEILWIPMVDEFVWYPELEDIIHDRVDVMPWCLFCDPTTIKIPFRFYIRKEWKFQNKPILVVLDNKGKVTCIDAFPIVTIWGESAYPFTSSSEEQLWGKISWNLEFLLMGIDPRTLSMIKQEKMVCFYGGDDLDWIKRFAKTVKTIIKGTGVRMELIYIGFIGRRDKLQRILTTIAKESISSFWSEETIHCFWFRFQGIYNSKIRHCKSTTLMEDIFMRELVKISTYDSSDHGWAMISIGSHDIVMGSGRKLMEFLERFPIWREKVSGPRDFLRLVREEMSRGGDYGHCTHTVIPMVDKFGQETMTCVECGRIMKKYYLYKCCEE